MYRRTDCTMRGILAGLVLIFVLSGCAAQRAYNKGVQLYDTGQVDEGLAKMDKAYQLDPDNSEYRAEYFKRREQAVLRWQTQAEFDKGKGAWDAAEANYRHILKIDPDNPRAKSGLDSLDSEKKQAQLLNEAQALLENNDIAGALPKNPARSQCIPLQPRCTEIAAEDRRQECSVPASRRDTQIQIEPPYNDRIQGYPYPVTVQLHFQGFRNQFHF